MDVGSCGALHGIMPVISRLVIGANALVSLRAGVQTGGLPRFDAASIKENTSGDARSGVETMPGGRFVATNVVVKELIAEAFAIADPPSAIDVRVVGGPAWIGSAHVDITANANAEFRSSPDGPDEGLLLMMRALLEDRFALQAHRETRELPVYELVVARADGRLGPQLRPSPTDCEALVAAVRAGGRLSPRRPSEPPPSAAIGGAARIIAGGVAMPLFVKIVATVLATSGERGGGRLVLDKTGLTGRFAFTLAWAPEPMPTATPPPGSPPIDPNGSSFVVALQEQLGLTLRAATAPVEVLVIDSVDRPSAD